MSECLLDRIATLSHSRYYYDGWANGVDGAISDFYGNGVFRFYKSKRDSEGNLIDELSEDIEEYPIVATGIVAYWLHVRTCKNNLARLIAPPPKNPQPFLKVFEDYTNDRLNQYKKKQEEEDPSSWRRDIEKEFYTKFIIHNEEYNNKQTEAFFEYINPEDRVLVKEVMNEYILYLKERKKYYSPLKTANKPNKKSVQKRIVDVEKLKTHFGRDFLSATYIPILKELLEQNQSDKDLARAALLIYESKFFVEKDYSTFSRWYRDFCGIVKCGFHNDYTPGSLRDKKYSELKVKFSFL